MLNSIYSLGCKFFIDKPTRITSNNASCIDHVESDLDTDQIVSHIVKSDVLDHYSTLSNINFANMNQNNSDDVFARKRNLSPAEWRMLNNELKHILELKASLLNSQIINVEQYATQISDTYQYILDKYMPYEKLSRKESSFHKKPWITSALKNSIKRKNDLYVASRSKNAPLDAIQKYSQYRNLLTKLLRKSKDNYYIEKFLMYGQDKSKTWQLVNEITNRKKGKNQNIPKSLNDEKKGKIKDRKKIANALNAHFGTIGEKMAT